MTNSGSRYRSTFMTPSSFPNSTRKTALVIIDPQYDFHGKPDKFLPDATAEGGTLAVPEGVRR